LDVKESFANSTLRLCTLTVDSGQPYYSNPLPTNTKDAAQTILQRYSTLYKDPELTTMSGLISNVDLTKDSVKIEGNIKLEVTVISDEVSMAFIKSQNGVDFGRLTIVFQGGRFLTFFDSRSYCKIGSADVNISKEQAINMALNAASNFSYHYKGQLIDNLTFVESAIRTELRSNVRDVPTLFYPCWQVDLPLHEVYPGAVYYIEVKIWADSGQILEINEMGYGGVLPNPEVTNPTNSPTPNVTVSKSDSTRSNAPVTDAENAKVDNQLTIPTVIVITVLAVSITASVILRKHQKSNTPSE
jgi:hypothetical protein